MAYIKNQSAGDCILPDGTALVAGRVTMVDDKAWKQHLEHPVVKGWIEEERRLIVANKAEEEAYVAAGLLDPARHADPTAGRRTGILPTPVVLDEAARAVANAEPARLDAEAAKLPPMTAPESELLKNAPRAASEMSDPAQKQAQSAKGGEPSPKGSKEPKVLGEK